MRRFKQLTNVHTDEASSVSAAEKQGKTNIKQRPIYDSVALRSLESSEVDCSYILSPNQTQMRQQLFKWLIAKCMLTLQLRLMTIEHCFKLFDFYVHKRGKFMSSLDETQFHLLTCLFISCKYQEIYPPSITDFQYVSKYKYTAKDFIQLEIVILKQIDFYLNFSLTSDWYYGITGKNVPAWLLLSLPKLAPGFSLRKVAQLIDQIPEVERNQYYQIDDEIMAERLINKLKIIYN